MTSNINCPIRGQYTFYHWSITMCTGHFLEELCAVSVPTIKIDIKANFPEERVISVQQLERFSILRYTTFNKEVYFFRD